MKVDQVHLRRLLEAGDLDGFVTQLDPLCVREVMRVARNGLDIEDLLQEARTAVFAVAQRWDPARGANPLTLAVRYVRHRLWTVTGRELAATRRANVEAISLDQRRPAGFGDGDDLLALRPAPGPAVDELAIARIEARKMLARLDAHPGLAERATSAARHWDGGGQVPRAVRFARHVIGGGQLQRDVVFVSRHPRAKGLRTAQGAMRSAERHDRDVLAVSATKRKLRDDGTERAPQGRPGADGSLGRPVWRVDVLRIPPHEIAREQEAA